MSTFTGESSGSTNNDNFELANKFFAEVEAEAPPTSKNPKSPIPPQISKDYSSKCASWVRDNSFEVRPSSEPSERGDSNFNASPLPESVRSWSDFLEKSTRNREKSKEIEEQSGHRKRKSGPTPPPSFFKRFEEKLAETRQEIHRNPQNWTKLRGIFMEKFGIVRESSVSDNGPKSKFTEIMAIFETQNTEIYQSIGLDNGYKLDWKRFDEGAYQFVVFTKVCQSHPPEEFVEMRKEDTHCTDCGSPNLAVTVRLTVPLDLADIPIPIFEDVQIHVSFLVGHLLDKSAMVDSFELMEKSCDFSRKNCEKMWTLHQRMVKEGGETSWEYKKWFDASREFVKTTLHAKTLHLLHGRVVRRKIEDNGVDSKKRCSIFAQLFELDD